MPTRHVILLLALWLAASLALGASGVLTGLKPPLPQAILVAITILVILAGIFIRPLRQWAMSVDLRLPVAFHLTRFVGFYFLYLYSRDELPYAFAVPGGIGDIIVAALALLLIMTTSPNTPRGRWLYLGWNILGLIDILGVVATAATQALTVPGSMDALLRLPLCLLLLFVVPIIIATHVLLMVRLLRTSSVG